MQKIRQFFSHPVPLGGDLSIRALGTDETMRAGIVDRPGGTGDYMFMLFLDPMIIEVWGERNWHPAGTLMLWGRGDAHYYGNPNQGWSHSWTHCDGAFVAGLLEALQLPVGMPTPFPHRHVFEDPVRDLHIEMTGYGELDTGIVRSLFELMLRKLARAIHRPPEQRIPERFLRARRFIEEHYREALTLADVALVAGCSTPHFCAEFKRYFGSSAVAYAIQLRMEEARFLLRDVNLNVGEVAARVGVEDPYYFSRVFKKQFGLSPLQMRK